MRRMEQPEMHLGWSSCVYPLSADDFADVPDYAGDPIPESDLPDDDVILLLGRGDEDSLLRGRDVVRASAGKPVNVRVVFRPSIPKWNVVASVVRVLRNRFRYRATGRYHIAAKAVREMGLERARRTLDNPQPRKNKDRAATMERLRNSLKTTGYDDSRPIVVMLCRTWGCVDSLRQGHHRVSACIECGVERMAVTFDAAGAVPWCRRRLGLVRHGGNQGS